MTSTADSSCAGCAEAFGVFCQHIEEGLEAHTSPDLQIVVESDMLLQRMYAWTYFFLIDVIVNEFGVGCIVDEVSKTGPKRWISSE